MITRFAPSPTGHLHLGHAYSAILAWRQAQNDGGTFLLRFEDIDHTRVRAEFYSQIEEDLQWLGIHWPTVPIRQLDRIQTYEQGLEKLKKQEVMYPCFCTRKDLAAMSAPQQGQSASLYQGTCRHITAQQRERQIKQGEAFAWRMDMARANSLTGPLFFQDQRFGSIPVDPHLIGDPILARKDIATSYHLAVVLDDAAQEVTQVIRGDDLLESTHIHRVLQALLGLPCPHYFHHRLVTDDEGRRLAKRHDSLSIKFLRETGMTPEEIWQQAVASLAV